GVPLCSLWLRISLALPLAAVLASTAVHADNAPLPHIDSKRAFQYTREDDAFTADTVEGKFPVRNIIAKFPGTKDGIIVIMGHYDTNYWLRGSGYVGANDGGSSTAILLEFANQLHGAGSGGGAGKKRDGYSVWLVWTDGEEAVKTWTATDSL